LDILNVYKQKNGDKIMANLERKTLGELNIDSLNGASFFSGDIKNNLLATITNVFKDKKTQEIIIWVNYPSTGSSSRCSLESCKDYFLANSEEVKATTKEYKGYSE